MKLSVVQENLAQALSVVSRIIPPRPSLAILNNILLKTATARLELTATNLEMALVYKIGAKIEAEGSLTVPGRLFADLVGGMGNDKVHLISSEQNLRIKSTGVNSMINGIGTEDFPVIPAIKPKTTVSIPAGVLHQALASVVVASAVDEARPVLNGIFFDLQKDKLVLATTDSYRLAEVSLPLKNTASFSAIVPVRAIQELIRVSANSSQPVNVGLSDNEANFSLGDVQLISRLIEGNYPNYSEIFPKSATTAVVVDREELIKTVRLAALFARESANTIKLSISKDKFLITAQANEVGENTSEVPAKITGQALDIQLNARYMLDALSSLPTEAVTLELTGDINPCLVRPKGSAKESLAHIIMPLRT